MLGSLTFGGSDLSRYTPSNVSFALAPDVERDLVVGLQSISVTITNSTTYTLLPSPILTFIDSTIPYIYLPKEACEKFEANLGLTYNEDDNLYLVDDNLHQQLRAMNPTFKFQIGNDKTSQSTVEIVLPYDSFDLTAKYPFFPNDTQYFPIRRASNESEYTLGRTFLQEA